MINCDICKQRKDHGSLYDLDEQTGQLDRSVGRSLLNEHHVRDVCRDCFNIIVQLNREVMSDESHVLAEKLWAKINLNLLKK